MSIHEADGLVLEQPQNGLAGLKHWRHDILAGLMVSLTSLPFSLGIAVASGAPPIAGLVSAIIAGLIFPFLGGSYVTISGPAAGLAPALMAAMIALGHGHLDAGYPLLLAVICMVGLDPDRAQPARRRPAQRGVPGRGRRGDARRDRPDDHRQGAAPLHRPRRSRHTLSSASWPRRPARSGVLTRRSSGVGPDLPGPDVRPADAIRSVGAWRCRPPLAVVLVGVVLGQVLGIDGHHLIRIPDNILAHGITLPDFAGLFVDHSLVRVGADGVLTLVLIDGVESLATIKAIDKVDPFHRKSNPDRTLLAMGVSNICSSLGGRPDDHPRRRQEQGLHRQRRPDPLGELLQRLLPARLPVHRQGPDQPDPVRALAAILIYTGYKMCEPKIWRHIAHIGREQIFLFATTSS